MHKKLGYALWLKIACPGQITHQKIVFPLQDLTLTAYKTMSQNFDIINNNNNNNNNKNYTNAFNILGNAWGVT